MHDVLTDAEVADLLGCESSTINERAASGDLPAVKFGRSWRFPREALLKVLNEKALANKPTRPAPAATTAEAPRAPRSRRKLPPLVSIQGGQPSPRP